MRWDEFVVACPAIGRLAEDRFRRDHLAMLGTIRADGFPRISPCEVDFSGGELFLGMMWRSRKARDLLRDPRCIIHSVTCNKDGTDGDVKLYGRTVEERELKARAIYREAVRARTGWAPEEPDHHVFTLRVESAGYVVFGREEKVLTWDQRVGLRELPFPEAE